MSKRPTDAEFDELKRKRDANIREWFRKRGWAPPRLKSEFASTCYCNCPVGPCQHEWVGWVKLENGGSRVCSRCGMTAISHDMRCGP